MPIVLEKEYQYYCKNLRHLCLSHLNEFVLIKGLQVCGFYKSYDEALKAGLKQFGNTPFFIKEVQDKEDVRTF